MRNKASAKIIGMFVIGGIVLLLAGLVAFSSMNLFSRRMEFVMYFDGSLNGLAIGSPVSFRGVDIGQVTNIVMEIDRGRRKVLTPVYVEIEPERFRVSTFSEQISLLSEPPIKRMIENGLRAQLQTRSLITGQMFIELEFHPHFPANFKADKESGVDEIPTIPSPLDQVQATVRNVLESMRQLELEKLVVTAADTLRTTHAAAYEFYEVMHKVNQKIDPILENVDTASVEGKVTLVELRKTLQELNKAVDKAGKAFAAVDKEITGVSPVINKGADNARVAFDEVASAMRALKELADYLERNPDALLTGKQNKR